MAPESGTGNAQLGNRWRFAMWGGAACLLLLPAIAMRFTSEVDWDARDFITMGAMLAAACGAYEIGARMSRNFSYRAGFALMVLASFVLVWGNLAAGLIGTERNPANLVFAGVLALVVGGAFATRCQPQGMARTMFATAVFQAVIGVFALLGGWVDAFVVCGVFVALWLASAWLFARAARATFAR